MHKNPMPPDWEAWCAAQPPDDPLLQYLEELWDYSFVPDEITDEDIRDKNLLRF